MDYDWNISADSGESARVEEFREIGIDERALKLRTLA
jgi:hypothetical protein